MIGEKCNCWGLVWNDVLPAPIWPVNGDYRTCALVGSKADAVATGTGNSCWPGTFATFRGLSPSLNSVSSFRHVVLSMRIFRTTHSCPLRAKGCTTCQAGSAFSDNCLGRDMW